MAKMSKIDIFGSRTFTATFGQKNGAESQKNISGPLVVGLLPVLNDLQDILLAVFKSPSSHALWAVRLQGLFQQLQVFFSVLRPLFGRCELSTGHSQIQVDTSPYPGDHHCLARDVVFLSHSCHLALDILFPRSNCRQILSCESLKFPDGM